MTVHNARIVPLVATLVSCLLLAGCFSPDTTVYTGETAVENGITVSGTGEASAPPDMAILELGIEVASTSVADARERAARAANSLIQATKANGVQDRDIQTRSVSVSPQYDYSRPGTPTIIGYLVQNTLVVRVRDLDRLATIVDAALDAAGDAARLQGLQFTFSDPEELQKTARQRAIEDARTRAEAYAAAAGVRLGTVVAITETTSGGPVPLGIPAGGRIGADSTPIETGESTVTVTVTVRYQIEP